MSQHEPVYLVVHIPKTAGSTLRKNFELNFRGGFLPFYLGRDGERAAAVCHRYLERHASAATRCVFGHHVTSDLHRWLPAAGEPRYVTFLRHPVDRCVSLYHELRSNASSDHGRAIREQGISLEDWIEEGAPASVSNGQVKALVRSAEDFRFPAEATESDASQAAAILEGFFFVGATERFGPDSHCLYGLLGFRRFSPQLASNTTRAKRAPSARALRRLEEENAVDMALYEAAMRRRASFAENRAREYARGRRRALTRRSLDLPRQLVVELPRLAAGRLRGKPS